MMTTNTYTLQASRSHTLYDVPPVWETTHIGTLATVVDLLETPSASGDRYRVIGPDGRVYGEEMLPLQELLHAGVIEGADLDCDDWLGPIARCEDYLNNRSKPR